MNKQQVQQINADFIFSTMQNLETKNAQLAVAIGISEGNELMICSNNRLTNKEVYQVLMEAAKAIENNKDGLIITLN